MAKDKIYTFIDDSNTKRIVNVKVKENKNEDREYEEALDKLYSLVTKKEQNHIESFSVFKVRTA